MGDWQIQNEAQRFSMIGRDILARPLAVYPSLTANIKGLWVELSAATAIPASAFTVMVPYVYEGSDYLIDIGIGPGGSEQVLAANLLVTCGSSYGNKPVANIRVPLPIPEGTRVAVRVQATGTSSSRMIRCALLLEDNLGQSGGRLVTIGAATADSGGTSIDPGASDNSKGAWVQLDAAVTTELRGVFLGFGNAVNTTRTECFWLVDLGVGGAGAERVLIPDVVVAADTNTDSLTPVFSQVYAIRIPAGTRIAVRAACTIVDATDRLFDIVVYGIA